MATKKARSAFVCGECGSEHAKWQGQCNACEAWNTLSRVNIGPIAEPVRGFAGAASEVKRLADVKAEEVERIATGLGELDRVLGGGLVPGSMILIGGDPGAGKSTLLLQVATMLARTHKVLYVTGEESLTQLAMRAHRPTSSSPRALPSVCAVVAELIGGRLKPKGAAAVPTFGEVAKQWTSGELQQRYPDQIKSKRTAAEDVGRLTRYVYPVLRDTPIDCVTLDQCDNGFFRLHGAG